MSPAEFDATSSDVLCRHCGHRKGEHGGELNPYRPFACPGGRKFPRWSVLTERILGNEAAFKRYDRAVARFWLKRSTTFERA